VIVDPPRPADEIVIHYRDDFDEGGRLTGGLAELELLRTREVIRRHLGSRRVHILDVGGATGVHAAWLAEDGHRVHVVDPIEAQVARALQRPAAQVGQITAEVGDARRLRQRDASVDVVLLFGPLYHLTERRDRLLALTEAMRVTRPAGLVFIAAISRFASLFDGLARGFLFEPDFAAIVEADLRDGQHRNPTRHPHWFTTAFFHHPEQLRSEVEEAGLHVRELVGVEGLAGWLGHLEQRWDDPKARETIIWSARVTEAEPTLLGLSPHLLVVGEKSQ
jgi:2-polyprenyl-3-methyl-5-hydroxy-6-metoxy-1,4-benzoquinol methylase